MTVLISVLSRYFSSKLPQLISSAICSSASFTLTAHSSHHALSYSMIKGLICGCYAVNSFWIKNWFRVTTRLVVIVEKFLLLLGWVEAVVFK